MFDGVTRDDIGRYTCVATNEQGAIDVTIFVDVVGKLVHFLLRYRSRCQDDIFPRIELIPSFVLSSDNTNCKNDIQLFHQLFDELSVHTDYH